MSVTGQLRGVVAHGPRCRLILAAWLIGGVEIVVAESERTKEFRLIADQAKG